MLWYRRSIVFSRHFRCGSATERHGRDQGVNLPLMVMVIEFEMKLPVTRPVKPPFAPAARPVPPVITPTSLIVKLAFDVSGPLPENVKKSWSPRTSVFVPVPSVKLTVAFWVVFTVVLSSATIVNWPNTFVVPCRVGRRLVNLRVDRELHDLERALERTLERLGLGPAQEFAALEALQLQRPLAFRQTHVKVLSRSMITEPTPSGTQADGMRPLDGMVTAMKA